MSAINVAVSFKEAALKPVADALAVKLNLPIADRNNFDYLLIVSDDGLSLQSLKEKFNPIKIDFSSGKSNFRQKFSGKKQLLSRAMGLHRASPKTILDATTGMGTDSYVLATLGCMVHACERSPIISALLEDALDRARANGDSTTQRINLCCGNAIEFMSQLDVDLIYLDPMFPVSGKSALNKKEMRVLSDIVGADQDAKVLFEHAMQHAKERVVCKRPVSAPPISDYPTSLVLKGSSIRFDIYLKS